MSSRVIVMSIESEEDIEELDAFLHDAIFKETGPVYDAPEQTLTLHLERDMWEAPEEKQFFVFRWKRFAKAASRLVLRNVQEMVFEKEAGDFSGYMVEGVSYEPSESTLEIRTCPPGTVRIRLSALAGYLEDVGRGRDRPDGRNGRKGGAMGREPLIPKHGGYRKLKSFQVAQLVYDVTVRFCDRYVDRRSRTHDQMVQAARSGVQNIAEGSQASGTSKKMELKLTNVARASLEELRLDYEDFLRQRRLTLWENDDPRRADLVARRCATADEVARWVKGKRGDGQYGRDGLNGQGGEDGDGEQSMPFTSSISSTYPEIAANAALVLIGVAVALLDRQIAAQAEAFESEGGFTERLYRVRQSRRQGG